MNMAGLAQKRKQRGFGAAQTADCLPHQAVAAGAATLARSCQAGLLSHCEASLANHCSIISKIYRTMIRKAAIQTVRSTTEETAGL